jgi:hypothetical protein
VCLAGLTLVLLNGVFYELLRSRVRLMLRFLLRLARSRMLLGVLRVLLRLRVVMRALLRACRARYVVRFASRGVMAVLRRLG